MTYNLGIPKTRWIHEVEIFQNNTFTFNLKSLSLLNDAIEYYSIALSLTFGFSKFIDLNFS